MPAANFLLLKNIADRQALYQEEADVLVQPEILSPVEWSESHFVLVEGAGYASTGRLILYPWQREPVNAIAEYDRVIYCGPVQTGKSLIAECACWWVIDNYRMHSMYCYAKKDTVEDVFKDRIKPTIEEVPRLRRLWNGDPDNLTQSKIKLRSCIMRVASAAVRSDLATFSAGLIYASEVCKYRELDYDVIKLLRGRQEAYGMTGRKKEILESSPVEEGDILHKEMFKTGVLNLEPYMPCPTCGTYQVLLLSQIKEIPNEKKEIDHNPDRIRQDDAAIYECVYCGQPIQEKDRIDIGERVVWAAKNEKISKEGKVIDRKKHLAVSFQWNRLVDYSFKFSECLARFFEASRAGDPIKLRSFINEDLGQFSSLQAEQRSSSWMMTRIQKYTTHDDTIPDGVLVVLCGIDTQDNGFYFVLRGFGAGKESWLLDCDWIPCDMQKDQNPDEVLKIVRERISKRELYTKDGRRLFISMGMIDRGGHRAAFVDYLVSRLDNFYAYIGSADKLHPLVKQSRETGIIWGNTKNLSLIVNADSQKENWHLPEDIQKIYMDQFVRQYEREEYDRYGNTVKKWVSGGADHLRDCENYIIGAFIYLGLEDLVFSGDNMDAIKQTQKPPVASQQQIAQQTDNYFADIQQRYNRGRRF